MHSWVRQTLPIPRWWLWISNCSPSTPARTSLIPRRRCFWCNFIKTYYHFITFDLTGLWFIYYYMYINSRVTGKLQISNSYSFMYKKRPNKAYPQFKFNEILLFSSCFNSTRFPFVLFLLPNVYFCYDCFAKHENCRIYVRITVTLP